METESGGKGGRQPDGRRSARLPAEPGAHCPFNGAEPGGEGRRPPLPCQVVSPGGGAAAGGGGARRGPRAARGGGGSAEPGAARAAAVRSGGDGADPGMGHPWGLSLRDALQVISQKFWSSC